MPEYDNTNTGVIFKTTEKKTAKSPDYYGTLDVEGVEYRISGWAKQTRNGMAISMAIAHQDPAPDDEAAPVAESEDEPF